MRPTPTRKDLGRRIRKLRKKARISQEQLGFMAGLHRTYIGSIERGEQNVSVDNLHKLARALKIQVKELFDR